MSVPTEIKVHKKSATLELIYADGHQHFLSAEYLRVFSPSAEVQGHTASQAILQFGKKNVSFRDLAMQGNYAIKITFSDGHDSGIYSWTYLKSLADEFEHKWPEYLAALETAGKSREPRYIAAQ